MNMNSLYEPSLSWQWNYQNLWQIYASLIFIWIWFYFFNFYSIFGNHFKGRMHNWGYIFGWIDNFDSNMIFNFISWGSLFWHFIKFVSTFHYFVFTYILKLNVWFMEIDLTKSNIYEWSWRIVAWSWGKNDWTSVIFAWTLVLRARISDPPKKLK